MNVDDYRKAFTAEMDKTKQTAATSRLVPLSAPDGSSGKAAADGDVSKYIATFRDTTQSAESRNAALQRILTATFTVGGFDPYRSSFRDALRAVAAEDKNQDLRTRALEILALDKDEVAQQLLLRGLENTAAALVPVAKAVQLLAHDDHGKAIPIARRIVSGNYDLDAKEEALRVLASDPASKDLVAGILSDRTLAPQLRSASATALRLIDPQRFEQLAQSLIVDPHENDDVKANALGALDHLQGLSTKLNSDFTDKLSKLDLTGKSDDLRAAATRFLQARTPK